MCDGLLVPFMGDMITLRMDARLLTMPRVTFTVDLLPEDLMMLDMVKIIVF